MNIKKSHKDLSTALFFIKQCHLPSMCQCVQVYHGLMSSLRIDRRRERTSPCIKSLNHLTLSHPEHMHGMTCTGISSNNKAIF